MVLAKSLKKHVLFNLGGKDKRFDVNFELNEEELNMTKYHKMFFRVRKVFRR